MSESKKNIKFNIKENIIRRLKKSSGVSVSRRAKILKNEINNNFSHFSINITTYVETDDFEKFVVKISSDLQKTLIVINEEDFSLISISSSTKKIFNINDYTKVVFQLIETHGIVNKILDFLKYLTKKMNKI